jgi:hypothetical protein
MSTSIVTATAPVFMFPTPKEMMQERLTLLGKIHRLVCHSIIQYQVVEHDSLGMLSKKALHPITRAEEKCIRRAVVVDDRFIHSSLFFPRYLDYYRSIHLDLFTSKVFVVHTLKIRETALSNVEFYLFLRRLVSQGDAFMIKFIFDHPDRINECSPHQLIDLVILSIRCRQHAIGCFFLQSLKEKDDVAYKKLLIDLLNHDELYQYPEFFESLFYEAYDEGEITGAIVSICLLKAFKLDADPIIEFLLENISNTLEILSCFVENQSLNYVQKMVQFKPFLYDITAEDFLELAFQSLEKNRKQIAYALVGGRDSLFAFLRQAYINFIYDADTEGEQQVKSLWNKIELTPDENWEIAQLKRSLLVSIEQRKATSATDDSSISFDQTPTEDDVSGCVSRDDLEGLYGCLESARYQEILTRKFVEKLMILAQGKDVICSALEEYLAKIE